MQLEVEDGDEARGGVVGDEPEGEALGAVDVGAAGHDGAGVGGVGVWVEARRCRGGWGGGSGGSGGGGGFEEGMRCKGNVVDGEADQRAEVLVPAVDEEDQFAGAGGAGHPAEGMIEARIGEKGGV